MEDDNNLLIQQKFKKMIYESKVIDLEEKGQMIQLLYDNEMRSNIVEILQEINSPKRIDNLECLKLIADILRFVLTLFVHESEADPKLLACILDSS